MVKNRFCNLVKREFSLVFLWKLEELREDHPSIVSV